MLEHPFDNLAQESWIAEQRSLCQLFVEPTTTFGHRLTSIDGLTVDLTILEDNGPSFPVAHRFTGV